MCRSLIWMWTRLTMLLPFFSTVLWLSAVILFFQKWAMLWVWQTVPYGSPTDSSTQSEKNSSPQTLCSLFLLIAYQSTDWLTYTGRFLFYLLLKGYYMSSLNHKIILVIYIAIIISVCGVEALFDQKMKISKQEINIWSWHTHTPLNASLTYTHSDL